MIALFVTGLPAEEKTEGPTSEKAQKSYKEALEHAQKHNIMWALDNFKKADKQDGGRCVACQRKIVKYGMELREWKTAESAAEALITEAHGDKDLAVAHYQLGLVMLAAGIDKKKDELFTRSHEEMTKALAAYANFPDAILLDGQALARLKQDDAAKVQFRRFANMQGVNELDRQRATRYTENPELARARMAPNFAFMAGDGKRLSMDDMRGKVVLLDFWATWCTPCVHALPHMREIAKKFRDEPLVMLSVSLDDDEQKWKEFIVKNEMAWPQYRDGGFTGPIVKMFAVQAIPQTFTIDCDGVLQDQHIGDAAIEGKLKKLLAQAKELQAKSQH